MSHLNYVRNDDVSNIAFLNDDDLKLKRNSVGIYNFQTNELNAVHLLPPMNLFWLHLEFVHNNL